MARALLDDGGWWQPYGIGPYVVVVAEAVPRVDPIMVQPCGSWIVDELVAFECHRPDRWWLRRGDVPLLGAAEVAEARAHRRRLVIHPHPLAWVQAGGQGCCVLDWDHLDPRTVFHGLALAAPQAVADRIRRRHDELVRPGYRLLGIVGSGDGGQRHAP